MGSPRSGESRDQRRLLDRLSATDRLHGALGLNSELLVLGLLIGGNPSSSGFPSSEVNDATCSQKLLYLKPRSIHLRLSIASPPGVCLGLYTLSVFLVSAVFKKLLQKALLSVGLGVTDAKDLDLYRSVSAASILYSSLPQHSKELVAPFLPYSKSQLGQDLFALAYGESTSAKFFVEFGATDGVSLSNTWLLEKMLGWNGILAEPAKIWHNDLFLNRTCAIETKCVARYSGHRCRFVEVNRSEVASPELSGLAEFAKNGDWASSIRANCSTAYEVETISLNDLLDAHNAPADIQFLSLDTEGSELDILMGYKFGDRKIRSICVEHNYVSKNRDLIRLLLLDNGYEQVLRNVSRWDDWYLLR